MKKKIDKKKWAAFALFLAVLLVSIVMLFFRIPQTEDRELPFECEFEDGTKTMISFSDALKSFKWAETDCIVLEKEGVLGRVRVCETYTACMKGLSGGEVLTLFSLRGAELNGLEKTAILSRFRDTGYYLDEFFAWDGERVLPEDRSDFSEVYLIGGSMRKGILQKTGATRLVIKTDADFSASALTDSAVKEVIAEDPYFVKEGAVYKRTAGGVRLISGLPFAEELTVSCDYLDEGSLAPCGQLKKLKLPATYTGTVKMLFGDKPVPEGLEVL